MVQLDHGTVRPCVYLSVGAPDNLPAERPTGRTELSLSSPDCDDTEEHLQVKGQQSDASQLYRQLRSDCVILKLRKVRLMLSRQQHGGHTTVLRS